MTRQLILIDDHREPEWRLDESTKRLGLAYVQRAREVLAQAARAAAEREVNPAA